MKVLFMGTPIFAVESLRLLTENHDVVAVITQPDKQKGRGKKVQFTPIKEVAISKNIPVYQPNNVNQKNSLAELKKLEFDICIVVAYGQIVSEAILNMPKHGCINVHGSLLPKYRGASPIHSAILNGDKKTGVTIMYMEKGLDTGDMILKEEVEICDDDTTSSLHDKLSVVGASALIKALEQIDNGTAKREKQNNAESTYSSKITKDMAEIDWNKTSTEIINLIRGLNSWPCAFSILDGTGIKIWNARKVDGYNKGESGQIIDIIKNKGIVVKTGDGCILIDEIQLPSSKKMLVTDYLRGNKIEIGSIFKSVG